MNHRGVFCFSLLSFTLLLYPFVYPADPRRDAGAPIPGAQYVGSLPNGHGTTEIAPTANMPKGPDINPQYGGQTNSSGTNSSVGGIFGFLWNLGKKSEREIRRDAEIAKMDKILAKAASGIPLSPEESAFTGAGKMIPQPSIHVAATAPVATPAPAPTVVAPAPQIAHIAGRGQAGITCMPQVGSEADGMARPWEQSSLPSIPTAQEPSMIDKPNFPQFNFKNPPTIGGGLRIPSNNGSGNGNNGGGLVQGAGALMTGGGAAYGLMQTAPVAAPATAGGATAGGGTVVTTGSTIGAYASWFVTAVLPPVALIVGAGVATHAILDYVHPDEKNIFFKEKARQAIAEKAAKSQGSSSSSTTGGNGDNGKDKKGGTTVSGVKERKVNEIPRTEVMRKIKENYRYDKQSDLYKLKDNGQPIKCSRTGKDIEGIYWDGQHGDIEAYRKGGNHLGSLEPETFEMYKGPVMNRKVKL